MKTQEEIAREIIDELIVEEKAEAERKKPQHVHDCDGCVFHGRFGPVDVYTCQTTILVRYGVDGDYASRDMFGEKSDYKIYEAMCSLIIQAQQTAFGGLSDMIDAVQKSVKEGSTDDAQEKRLQEICPVD